MDNNLPNLELKVEKGKIVVLNVLTKELRLSLITEFYIQAD